MAGEVEVTLHDALAGMRSLPQWFLWRLEWSNEDQKYLKRPCNLSGGVLLKDEGGPANWHPYEDTVAALQRLPKGEYTLGFYLTEEDPYWFLDMDKCVENGQWKAHVLTLCQWFPGALIERSSSGKGLHVIGRGQVPLHGCVHKPLGLEFYTEARGIAFGLDGEAQGSADTDHTAMVGMLVAQYFPYKARADRAAGAREEWRGPEDDEELIRRALAARSGAGATFGGKATFAQLWRGEVPQTSEADMALAAHLAFWTGCDEARMERLMMRSGLVREKWQTRRRDYTYLTWTIANACAGTEQVYREPERNLATVTAVYGSSPGVAGPSDKPISDDLKQQFAAFMELIGECGSIEDMHNDVIPAIRDTRMPVALLEPLAQDINRKLNVLGGKLPIAQLRKLINPPVIAGNDAPLWVQRHCYVKDNDRIFDCDTGEDMSVMGFRAEYNRLMPIKESGSREDALEWALTRWGMRTVQRVGYRPDQGTYFDWDGVEYVNNYNASSVPETATSFTPDGIAGVEAFKSLLWDTCGRRMDVYEAILYWFAHNVQFPGRKIRWAPLIKGVPGDAKTLPFNLLRAAMGFRNVTVTSNATLSNNGGFTDWACRAAVNLIEEIWLQGQAKYALYNATKEYITNDVVNINPKGKITKTMFNVTNHAATSNHNDAVPMERDDRRWLVIFTPWESREAMLVYCGVSLEQWKARVKAADTAWRNCGSELRAWFLSLEIPSSFDPDGEALMTPEKKRMISTTQEDAESVAIQIIEDGAYGVSRSVFSSSCLSNQLKIRAMAENFDLPKTSTLNRMFTRMGFSKISKAIKWRGNTHVLWIKNGISEDNDDLRCELDRTV